MSDKKHMQDYEIQARIKTKLLIEDELNKFYIDRQKPQFNPVVDPIAARGAIAEFIGQFQEQPAPPPQVGQEVV